MADPKGTDSKPTGPVKPPVLDLKPRAPSTATPESKPAPEKDPSPDPKPAAAKPAVAASRFAFGAAVTGGVLGLAAAYGLAWFGLWPTPPTAPAPVDPRLAQFASAIPELETVTQTTQAELSTLTRRLGALETAAPVTAAGEPVDLSGVETDIAALRSRLDQLAATPMPAGDQSAVDELQPQLTALATRLDEIAARLGTAEAGLRSLDTSMTAATATLAAQPSDIGAILQLPLILSGLDTAFASGRPYASELAALRAAMPAAAIPTPLANQAATGLSRPDAIASRFAGVLPAMLAARPGSPDAPWQDGALDWFRSAIALRPTGEIAGDTPEAVMSRLEGAMARRDFVTAESLLAALPAPMLAAAGEVPALVAAQAEAARFLDSLRAQALAGEVKP